MKSVSSRSAYTVLRNLRFKVVHPLLELAFLIWYRIPGTVVMTRSYVPPHLY